MLAAKSSEAAKKLAPIQIRWDEGDRRVVITPENEDRVTATVFDLIELYHHRAQCATFSDAFNGLISGIMAWISANEEKVHKAFLTTSDEDLLFLVVRKEVECDFDFTDNLLDFDIEIAQNEKFDLIEMSVLALPFVDDEESLSAFMGKKLMEYS